MIFYASQIRRLKQMLKAAATKESQLEQQASGRSVA